VAQLKDRVATQPTEIAAGPLRILHGVPN